MDCLRGRLALLQAARYCPRCPGLLARDVAFCLSHLREHCARRGFSCAYLGCFPAIQRVQPALGRCGVCGRAALRPLIQSVRLPPLPEQYCEALRSVALADFGALRECGDVRALVAAACGALEALEAGGGEAAQAVPRSPSQGSAAATREIPVRGSAAKPCAGRLEAATTAAAKPAERLFAAQALTLLNSSDFHAATLKIKQLLAADDAHRRERAGLRDELLGAMTELNALRRARLGTTRSRPASAAAGASAGSAKPGEVRRGLHSALAERRGERQNGQQDVQSAVQLAAQQGEQIAVQQVAYQADQPAEQREGQCSEQLSALASPNANLTPDSHTDADTLSPLSPLALDMKQLSRSEDFKKQFLNLMTARQKTTQKNTQIGLLQYENELLKLQNAQLIQLLDQRGVQLPIEEQIDSLQFRLDGLQEKHDTLLRLYTRVCQNLFYLNTRRELPALEQKHYLAYYTNIAHNIFEQMAKPYYGAFLQHCGLVRRYALQEFAPNFVFQQQKMTQTANKFKKVYSQEYEIYFFGFCKQIPEFAGAEKLGDFELFYPQQGRLQWKVNCALAIVSIFGYIAVQINDQLTLQVAE